MLFGILPSRVEVKNSPFSESNKKSEEKGSSETAGGGLRPDPADAGADGSRAEQPENENPPLTYTNCFTTAKRLYFLFMRNIA